MYLSPFLPLFSQRFSQNQATAHVSSMLSHHTRAVCVMKTVLKTTNAVSLTVEPFVSLLLSVRATVFDLSFSGQLLHLWLNHLRDWTGCQKVTSNPLRIYIDMYWFSCPLSQARGVSSQALELRAVCWTLLWWQRLPHRGEVLPQWMWTSVHCTIHRFDMWQKSHTSVVSL